MNFPHQDSIPTEFNVTPEETIFSVAEYIDFLNIAIKPIKGTVQGEIGRVDERGAAVYFTLCDKSEKAVLNCFSWKRTLQSIGMSLKEGMEVKIDGYAEIYKPYGKLSLQVQYITPVGEGALKLAFERLKKQLEEAGLFRAERKRKLPPYVEGIGLITSETGAAIKDFETHLGQHGLKLHFYDVRVEGIKAVSSIVKAIRWFNENSNNTDVLVITRGGGSLESLQAFNTIEIAKAIAGSKIPVMTAIGHEQDITIADLVADVRASVPTHAGKILGDPWRDADGLINSVDRNITSILRNKISEFNMQLSSYQALCVSCFGKAISQSYRDIDKYQKSMMRCFKDILFVIKKIDSEFAQNYERFQFIYRKAQNSIFDYENQIQINAGIWYKNLVRCITENEKLLLLSDPQLKLKQGYSITKDIAGRVLKSSHQVKLDAIIAVELYEGNLISKVEEIK